MTAGTSRMIAAGGSLISAATNSTAPDYGGTILGKVHEIVLKVDHVTAPAPIAEEYGGEALDELFLFRTWTCEATLRGYDLDAISALFGNTSSGTGAVPLLVDPGTFGPGDFNQDLAINLYYVSDDPANHPAWRMPLAIPRPDLSDIPFQANTDLTFRAVFKATRTSGNNWISIGPTADILP